MGLPPREITIAVDAMGGDRAPRACVLGALQAADEGEHPLLVGDPDCIRPLLARAGRPDGLPIQPASQVIPMDAPVEALRQLPDASLVRGLQLVRQQEAQGFVSAGNTAAIVAATHLQLKPIEGVRRPALACSLPCPDGQVLLVDVGATLVPRAEDLVTFGAMGAAALQVLGMERPRIGLLNVGSEQMKGRQLVRRAQVLFERTELEYVGFIEGDELFRNRADIVVCDGVLGNVVLKVVEGLAQLFRAILHKVGRAVSSPALDAELQALREQVQAADVGGAPLLGVQGTVVVAHGRSGPGAVARAIRVARRAVESNLPARVEAAVVQVRQAL